jgi:aspartyl-tRNA(Asn)/glutamyl-tRNA(Gln) amidotransferase subunit C
MLDEAHVQAVAKLARIALEAHEAPALAEQLRRILSLVDAMNAVDTTGVEPLAHPLEPVPRRRPDEVTEPDRREDFQVLAADARDGYYLVPRVVE